MKKLKNKKVLIIACAVILAMVAVVLIIVLNRKESFRSVKVNDQSGSIDLERNQNVIEIAKDMKLIPNDFVTVGDESLLDLLVDEDKHIAVRSSTKFSVDAVGNPKEGLVTINVTEGKSYIKIDNPLEPEDGFQVVTPNATISVRGTIFTVDYNPNLGITRVECVEGKVNVISKSGDEIDLLAGDVVEVIDTMTTSTLTQQEMDAITKVFTDTTGAMEENTDDTASEDGQGETEEAEGTVITELADANIGDTVYFGTWEYGTWDRSSNRENSLGRGVESMEWVVLDKQGSQILLFSKYGLCPKAFNVELAPVTWETCTIRSWLNDEFFNTAFGEKEKDYILTTLCENKDNPYYGASGAGQYLQPGDGYYPAGGNDTQDKVFLLSLEEIDKYFGVTTDDWQRYDTREIDWDAYVELCAEKSDELVAKYRDGFPTWWWLRSPGRSDVDAARVCGDGAVYVYGDSVHCENVETGSVRPALWLDTSNL